MFGIGEMRNLDTIKRARPDVKVASCKHREVPNWGVAAVSDCLEMRREPRGTYRPTVRIPNLKTGLVVADLQIRSILRVEQVTPASLWLSPHPSRATTKRSKLASGPQI